MKEADIEEFAENFAILTLIQNWFNDGEEKWLLKIKEILKKENSK